jgi:hypothetical protein
VSLLRDVDGGLVQHASDIEADDQSALVGEKQGSPTVVVGQRVRRGGQPHRATGADGLKRSHRAIFDNDLAQWASAVVDSRDGAQHARDALQGLAGGLSQPQLAQGGLVVDEGLQGGERLTAATQAQHPSSPGQP